MDVAVPLVAAVAIAMAYPVYLYWLYPWDRGIATHEGTFAFYTAVAATHTRRIYSGKRVSLALTVKFSQFTAVQATIEVRANGALVADGVIQKYGFGSRTFRLDGIDTLDLVMTVAPPATDPVPNSVDGTYQISVPVR